MLSSAHYSADITVGNLFTHLFTIYSLYFLSKWLLHLLFFFPLCNFIIHCSGNKWILNTLSGKCFIYVHHQKLCKYIKIIFYPPFNNKIHLLLSWFSNNYMSPLLLDKWTTEHMGKHWRFLVEFLLTPLAVYVFGILNYLLLWLLFLCTWYGTVQWMQLSAY